MIRFGWLQFRTQAAVAAGLLAVVAVTLVITGAHLRYLYDASGLAACPPHDDCAALTGALLTRLRGYAAFPVIYWAGIFVLYAVPAIIGMFWGAPLITRELEAGTMRLAWTQGVTRARWLAVKLGLAGLASMAAAGLLSLMVTWWAGPVDPLDPYGMNKLQPAMFGTRGIVPIGYAAFAFVLGVTGGPQGGHAGHRGRGRRGHDRVGPAAPHRARPRHLGAQPGFGAGRRRQRRGPGEQRTVCERCAASAGQLGVLHPGPQRIRPHIAGSRAPGLRIGLLAGVRQRAGQAAPSADGDLPAGQPVLGLAVGGNGSLGRARHRAGRVLLLVDPPAPAWINPGQPASGTPLWSR
jgi:hypothetical protein